MTWKKVLIASLIGLGLFIFPMTRFLIIRLFLLPAGLHWLFMIIFLVAAVVAGLLYFNHRRRKELRRKRREADERRMRKIREMEEDLGIDQDRRFDEDYYRQVADAGVARDYGSERLLLQQRSRIERGRASDG